MRLACLLVLIAPGVACAGEGVSGYVQEQFSYRAGGSASCGTVTACHTMVNEQRAQLLGEWQPDSQLSTTVRLDAVHDAVNGNARLITREAYVDYTLSPKMAIRAGRQVITWGVGDYLFVNDIFPKNYDAFFTGKPFDHMKEAIDAIKLNGIAGDVELELVAARPRQDEQPSGSRFTATAMPAGVALNDADSDGTDLALRVARKFGRWDAALYAARYQSRDTGLFAAGAALERRSARTRHIGASATGSMASGVALVEVAYASTDAQSGNMNPFMPSRRVKALVGYSRELGSDLSVSVQYHHEAELDYAAYANALAPGVPAVERHQETAYLRVQQRLLHQTLGLGMQVFASFDGGLFANPFVSYSIVDGLNLEAGANWFHGPATSRYGMMRHDKNVYASLRYSF